MNQINLFSGLIPVRDLGGLLFQEEEQEDRLQHFVETTWQRRPFAQNPGGMSLEACFFLHEILALIAPQTVIESGVWHGMTTYIIDSITKVKNIHCFDPVVTNMDFIYYQSPKARYYSLDWASSIFSQIPADNCLAIFDDHQDHMERLCLSFLRGIRYVVLENNYAFGGGEHKSLFDQLRANPEPDSFASQLIEAIYVSRPFYADDKGLSPLYDSTPEFLKNEYSHANSGDYNWLTFAVLRENNWRGFSQNSSMEELATFPACSAQQRESQKSSPVNSITFNC